MPGGRPKKYASEEEKRKIVIQRMIEWRKNHPEQYQETLRKKRLTLEYKSKRKIVIKRYKENNRDKINKGRRENARKRRIEDPIFKFKEITKGLIQSSFKRGNRHFQKRKRTEEILGCTIEQFTDYILNLCPKGIELKDFGKFGYHIDHIIPISFAKTEEEVIKLCHYTNLQPLWHTENIKKSNKIFENKDYLFLIYF